MIICQIDNTTHKTYRGLSSYIKKKYQLSSKEYYDKYIPHSGCIECGGICNFKNINLGYHEFCSNVCVNRYKVKDPIYLKKLSNSQIGKPRKKHSEKTKELCREIMLKEWSINREIRLQIHRSDTTREKISKSISLIGYKKNITYIHGIRCESKLEESFVNYCVDNNISIKRFRHKNKKSIKVGINWRVPDFIINKNMVIDVKDWHHWFRKELDDGLVKYKEIEKWCIPNGYSFYFWIDNQFKQIWQVIEQKTKN